MKNKKLILTIVICLVVIAATVGGLYWLNNKTVNTKADPKKPGGTGSNGTKQPAIDYPTFPLELGDQCDEVGALQRKLNEWMQYNYFLLETKPSKMSLVVDRKFGPKTLEFIRIRFGTDTVTEQQYNAFMAEVIIPTTGTKPFTLFGLV